MKRLIKSIDKSIHRKIYKQESIKHNVFSIQSIQKVVSHKTKIKFDLICVKSRKREIVEARQICMFFSKLHQLGSLEFIGENLGGKDHATVSYSCKTISNLYQTDRIKFELLNSIDLAISSAYGVGKVL